MLTTGFEPQFSGVKVTTCSTATLQFKDTFDFWAIDQWPNKNQTIKTKPFQWKKMIMKVIEISFCLLKNQQ